MFKKLKAFTLSEVMIALTLIGVITALAVPTLIGNADLAKKKTKVKKAYSTISNAYSQAVTEKGTVTNVRDLVDNLVQYMDIKYYYLHSNGAIQSTHGLPAAANCGKDTASNWMVTEDGIAYRIIQVGANAECTTTKTDFNTDAAGKFACYNVTIDIDGAAGKNTTASVALEGRKVTAITNDRFPVYIVKTGVTAGNPDNPNRPTAKILAAED